MNRLREMFQHNTVIKIISVIAAILLWLYVQMVQNPEIDYTFNNMPVNLVNATYLQKEGFVLPDTLEEYVDVTVKCQRWELNEIGRDDFYVYVDLTEVYQAGEVTLPVKVRLNNENIVLTNKEPSSVTMFVDTIVKVEIPLEIRLNGTVPTGYYTDETMLTSTTQTIVVSGPNTLIRTIEKAVAEINISGKNESFTQSCKIILLDNEEKTILNDHITMVPESAEVSIEVLDKKVVPIEIQGIPENIKYEILPGGLEIAGKAEAMEELEEIVIQDFQFRSTEVGYEQTYTIKAPEGIKLLSEEVITVKITQNDSGLSSGNQ